MSTTPRDRPIPFSEAEVRAILEGRKTQTRRVAKPPPKAVFLPDDQWKIDVDEPGTAYMDDESGRLRITCPYGQPGDQMWLRETWALVHNWEEDGIDDWEGAIPKDRPISPSAQVWHKAGHLRSSDTVEDRGFRWRPSIHMPRWASRITLEITRVRVERVQDITEADAKAEGVSPVMVDSGGFTQWDAPIDIPDYIEPFADLWDKLNAPRGHGWSVNPWVWVIDFERIKP